MLPNRKFVAGAVLSALAIVSSHARGEDATLKAKSAMHAPSSVEAEHRMLHDQLGRLTSAEGDTGKLARQIETLLRPHFKKEEQLALALLGLLPDLANGIVPADLAGTIRIADQLRRDMPQMLAEHKTIRAALQQLEAVARQENKQEGIRFARALADHAILEEQILYPAALLAGDYLKNKRP